MNQSLKALIKTRIIWMKERETEMKLVEAQRCAGSESCESKLLS